jgi:prepilin-type N-terminal cleavage/methylation domain-containing protein
MKRKGGFTLVELLVVVAIISLLSSIVLAALSTARAKARDAERIAELRSLTQALELYKNTFGQYPTNEIDPQTDTCFGNMQTFLGPLLTQSPTKYINEIPNDPKQGEMSGYPNTTVSLCYIYVSPPAASGLTCGTRVADDKDYIILFASEATPLQVARLAENPDYYCLMP